MISPNLKRGGPSDGNSYRPISFTYVIPKLFKTVISDKTHAFLDLQGLLNGR